MSQNGKALLLMLWKSFTLQIRRIVGTAVELITPILLVTILVALRVGQFTSENVCFSTYDDDPLTISQPNIPYTIFYTPVDTNSSDAIAEILKRKLPFATVEGVESERELESSLVNSEAVQPPITLSTTISGVQVDTQTGCLLGGAGIVFDDLESSALEFTLRLRQEVGQLDRWETSSREPRLVPVQEPSRTANPYLQEGFLHLQKVVEEAIVEWRSGQELGDVAVSVRRIPVPAFNSRGSLGEILGQIAFFVVLGFLYPAAVFCKELVLEKETRVRELLLITGLKQWVLWTAWYIKQFLFLSFISLTITPILKYGGIFEQTDFGVLLLFLFLFSASIVSFGFLVSVLFDSGQAALLGGFVLFFLNYMPYSYIFLPDVYETLTLRDKIGLSILSNTAMSLGLQVMFTAELAGPGIQWNTISTVPSTSENLHLGHVCLMLAIDTLLYMIIAWYVDGIKPGKYGIAKPLYFPFLPSYWTGRPRNVGKNKKSDDEMEMEQLSGREHEEEPKELEAGVHIKNLTKIYDKSIKERLGLKSRGHQTREVAVDKLNLNLYVGQITALLGHNGAGKTTTMSILTGLYTPTGGTAVIGEFDIRRDMEQIRKSMSICPQHDILFGRLTVAEHLKLFGIFKGLSWKEVNSQIEELLEDIDLEEKKNTRANELSGGQKRKLSVCMALIGGSKFVVLDEPTSGMDPYARRATWNLLIKHKKNRTILFSTHFMDEADVLGDRIAIMAAGRLRCSGSSLFLKNRYGVGYHMIMEKAPSSTSDKVVEVISLVRSHVRGAKCVLDAGAELAFILPAEDTKAFPSLLQELERRKEELGIAGFGVSVTTMEEVFLKVKDESDEDVESRVQRKGSLRPNRDAPPVEPHQDTPPPAPVGENVGIRLWWQQYYGLLVKKVLDTVRYWQVFIPLCLLPIFATLLGLLLFRFRNVVAAPDPARELSVENSAIDTDSQILFWAKFGTFANAFDFESLEAGNVGATEFINITAGVTEIMDSVQSISNTSDCCNYQYQILDKYCALHSADELNSCTGTNFGYGRCRECLTCCETRLGADASCTNPFTQLSSSERVCPAVSKVSVTDAASGSATGRLDSDNTYVAEYLLANAERFSDYQTQVMGGLSVGGEEPTYSACGCSSPTDFTQSYVAPLQQCSDLATGGDRSYVVSGAFEWYNNTDCSSLLQTTLVGGVGSGVSGGSGLVPEPVTILTPLNASVRVDGSSLGALQALSCSAIDASSLGYSDDSVQEGCGENSTAERPVSAFFPEQTQRTSVTVWYSGKPWHMSAAMLNVFYNVWLRQVTGEKDLSITVNNHPLPRSNEGQLRVLLVSGNGYFLGVVVMGGFSLFLSLFILPILNEKNTQVKHLQHISGVRSSTYWSSILTVDALFCVVLIPVAVALFAAFQLDEYSGENLAAVAALLVACCASGIPLVYLFSYAFTDGLTAFAVLVFLLFLLSSQVARASLSGVASITIRDTLNYIFLTVPTYGLLSGISDIYFNSVARRFCTSDPVTQLACESDGGLRYVESIFSFQRPGVGVNILCGAVEAVIFFAVLWVLEHPVLLAKLAHRLQRHKRSKTPEDLTPIPLPQPAALCALFSALPMISGKEDSDVVAEREKVKNGEITDEHVVVIRNLIKIYPRHLDGLTLRERKVAVRGITLAIPKGECFGLLGTNGAGKTTTFRMLTGDLNPTSGSAAIKGLDVVTQFQKVRQHIGYCPQFGALLERLSGRELLTVFARLRGIPESSVKAVVESEIRRVDLIQHADKQCGKYSGGNKRKLSTGIALVGNPAVVFLDEPTTGMDTATRHFLWKVLTGVTRNGQSIILTSHSMEECEALCSRIGILVNGQFRCLGSVQHVKNKFGQGVVLQAKVELPSRIKEPPSPKSPGIFSRISGRSRRERHSSVEENRGNTLPSPRSGLFSRMTSRNRKETSVEENRGHTLPSPRSGIFSRMTSRNRKETSVEENQADNEGSSTNRESFTQGSSQHKAIERQTSGPTTPTSASFRRLRKSVRRFMSNELTLVEETPEEVLQPIDTTSIQSFLSQRYSGATLLEEHEGFVSYQLPLSNMSLARVFKDIEENKERLGITDYSVSQITLEQVFINFSRKQERVFKE